MSESKAASTSDSELVGPLPEINVLRETRAVSLSSATDAESLKEKLSYNYVNFPPAWDFYTLNQIDLSQRVKLGEPELAKFHEKVSRLEIPEINKWLRELRNLLPSLRLQLHRYGRIRKALDIGLEASRQNRNRAMTQLAALEADTCKPSTPYYPQLVYLRDLINLEADFIESDYVDQVAAHADVSARIVHAMIMILRLPVAITDLMATSSGEMWIKPTEWETDEDAILAASETPDSDALAKHYRKLLHCDAVFGLANEIDAGIADVPFYSASDMSPSKFNIQLPVVRIPITCAGMKALHTYAKLVDCMGYADLRIIRYLRCDPRVLNFNITKEWLYPMDSVQTNLHSFPTYGVSRMFMETGFVPICAAQDYYATRIDRCYASRADDQVDPRIPLSNVRLVVWAKLLDSLGEGVLGSLQCLMASVATSRYPMTDLTFVIGKLKGSLTGRNPLELAKVLHIKAVDHDPVALTMLDNLMHLCHESSYPRAKGSCYPQAVKYGYIVAERRYAGVCADGNRETGEKSKQLYKRLVERKHLTGISNVGLSAPTPAEKMNYFLQACDYTDPDHFAAAGYYAMDVYHRNTAAFSTVDRYKLNILTWRAALTGHYNAVHFFVGLLNDAPVEYFYWRVGYRLMAMSPAEAIRGLRDLTQRGTPLLTENARNLGSTLAEGIPIQTSNPFTNMVIGALSREGARLTTNTRLYGDRSFSKESVCREVAAACALYGPACSERTDRTFDYGLEVADIKDRTTLEIHARFPRNAFALGLMFERGLIPPSSKLFSDVKELCEPRLILSDAVTLSLAISCYTVALEKEKDRRGAYRLAVLFSRLSTADQVANTRVCKRIITKLAKSSQQTCIEWLAAYTTMDKTSSNELSQCLHTFRTLWMNDPQRRWPYSDDYLDLAYSLMPHVVDDKWCQDAYFNTLIAQIIKLSERMLVDPDWVRSTDETKGGDEQSNIDLEPKWWSPRYLSVDAQKKIIADAKLREEKKALDPYTPRPPQTQSSHVTTVLYPDLVPMVPILSTTLLNAPISKPSHSSRGLTQPLGLDTFVLALRSLTSPKRMSLLKSYRKYIAKEFGDSLEDGVGWATVDAAPEADSANTMNINADAVDVIVKNLLDQHRVLVRAPYLYVMAKRTKKIPLPLVDELSILAVGFRAKCPFATKELLTLRYRILALVGRGYCINAKEPDQHLTQGRLVSALPVESQLASAGETEDDEADDLRRMFTAEGLDNLDAIVNEVRTLITDATQANVQGIVESATSLLKEFTAFSAVSKRL